MDLATGSAVWKTLTIAGARIGGYWVLEMPAGEFLISVAEDIRLRVLAALAPGTPRRLIAPGEVLETLKRPPPPGALIFDARQISDFSAERLARMRRAASPELRRLPVAIIAETEDQSRIWSAAGAITVGVRAGKSVWAICVRRALDGHRHWIDTPAYVGPDRRISKPLFRKAARRLEDSPNFVKSQTGPAKAVIASVDMGQPLATTLRRLRISGQSLSVKDRDQRARFLADVRGARTQAMRSANLDVVSCLAELESEIERAGANGQLLPQQIDDRLYAALQGLH